MAINIVESLNAIGEADMPGPGGNSPAPGDFNISLCEIEHGSGARYKIGNFITELHLFDWLGSIKRQCEPYSIWCRLW